MVGKVNLLRQLVPFRSTREFRSPVSRRSLFPVLKPSDSKKSQNHRKHVLQLWLAWWATLQSSERIHSFSLSWFKEQKTRFGFRFHVPSRNWHPSVRDADVVCSPKHQSVGDSHYIRPRKERATHENWWIHEEWGTCLICFNTPSTSMSDLRVCYCPQIYWTEPKPMWDVSEYEFVRGKGQQCQNQARRSMMELQREQWKLI